MIRKRVFLISIFLSIVIGWAGGFLRLPYIDKNFSFLLGFLSALALALLLLIITAYFKKSNSVWTALTVLVLSGSIISLFIIYQRNAFLKDQVKIQKQKIDEQLVIIESSRNSTSIALLENILDEFKKELNNSPVRSISDDAIERLAAMNYSFQPYRLIEGDSLSMRKWSPERGQLLVSLSAMNIDSAAFSKIKSNISFQGAYLRDADLNGLNLNGIDFKNANLSGADLRGSKLNHSNLSDALLWGANLQNAELRKCNLTKVDLGWADLTEADLMKADLNGASLNDAILGKANLRGVSMEWAKSRNAYLCEADLSEAKLTGTDFGSANLTKTDFSRSVMDLVNFSDAIVEQANLSDVELSKATFVEEDWIQKLRNENVKGAKQIELTYKTIVEASGKYNYRLVKK